MKFDQVLVSIHVKKQRMTLRIGPEVCLCMLIHTRCRHKYSLYIFIFWTKECDDNWKQRISREQAFNYFKVMRVARRSSWRSLHFLRRFCSVIMLIIFRFKNHTIPFSCRAFSNFATGRFRCKEQSHRETWPQDIYSIHFGFCLE